MRSGAWLPVPIAHLAYTAAVMTYRMVFKRPVAVLLAMMAVALLAGCGSSDGGTAGNPTDAGEVPVLTLQPDGVFTVDDVAAAGWKKSKELSPETLPDVTGVWYGFYNQRDVEVWVYPSHDLAITSGAGPADDVTGKVKAGLWQIGPSVTRTGYGTYAIVGNLILLCEVKIEDCEGLLNSIK